MLVYVTSLSVLHVFILLNNVKLNGLKLLRVTSEYHSFHYMILRDYIHSSLSSEFFSFGAHIMKLVSLL